MHQQSFRDCLSEHDQKVLESIFSSIEVGSSNPTVLNLDIEAETKDIPVEQTKEVDESVKIELEGIRLTEKGNLDEAIFLFGNAIQVAPHRGSIYNNRAQALRLKGNDEGDNETLKILSENYALHDLIKAIELSTEEPRTRCQALCQRGLLFRKVDQIDAARQDFEEAAKLGSKFAKNQLVEINPYAALCNQMLQAVFAKIK